MQSARCRPLRQRVADRRRRTPRNALLDAAITDLHTVLAKEIDVEVGRAAARRAKRTKAIVVSGFEPPQVFTGTNATDIRAALDYETSHRSEKPLMNRGFVVPSVRLELTLDGF